MDIDIIIVDKNVDEVMCDGGHDTLGHPAVFYGFGDDSEIVCGYCGRKFIKGS